MSKPKTPKRWDVDKESSAPVRELIAACQAGDAPKVERMLVDFRDYLYQSCFEDTSRYGISLLNDVLYHCARTGNTTLVGLFTAAGADIDQPRGHRDGEGVISRLAGGLRDEHHAMIDWLLSRGAKADHIRYGLPVSDTLLFAAMGGSLRTVQLLVRHGVPLNGVSWNLQTALDYAINDNRHEVADYLRSVGAMRGADLDPPPIAPPVDTQGPTPKSKSKKR